MPRRCALAALLMSLVALPATGQASLPLAAPSGEGPDARAAVAELPRATAVNDSDGDKVFDELARARAASAGALPVIVSFRHDVATSDGVAAVRRVAPGVEVRTAFRIIPAFAGMATPAEIDAIASLDEVRQLELDDHGTPELDTATQVMGADAVVDEMGITGSLDGDEATFSTSDVAIAILDTGFHGNHLDLFGGKIVEFVDLSGVCAQPCDPGGHGTHVASIAAGLGRLSPSHRGVAPGASIVGIKIEGGTGSVESRAIEGFQLIAERRAELGIRVATISFGFGIATDGTSALERAVDAAWDAGVVCFKSAGNSGPGRGTVTIPGAARGILATGSILDHGGTSGALATYGLGVSSFSSRGPTTDGRIKPDLLAPGESISAARAGSANGYTTLSGTSMASPFAAGSAALMLGANPSLDPDQVRTLLRATAEDWGVPGPDVDHGWGRIQVREAVLAATATTPPASSPPAVPRHEVRRGQGPLLEATFDVTDTTFPVRLTAIADLGVLALDVSGPGVAAGIAGRTVDSTGGRQYSMSFLPTATGLHTVRALGAGTAEIVIDLSHSTA